MVDIAISTSTKNQKNQKIGKNENENRNKDKNENKKENRKTGNSSETEKENKNYKRNKLRIYSYNSRGFDKIKQQVCSELLKLDNTAASIICNQENFVLKGNKFKIQQALPEHHIFFKPAKKDGLEGRPVNGMFTAIPNQLKNRARDVSPKSDRLQGVILDIDRESTLLVNVYFPADPKTKTYNQDEDLENVLASIENMIQTHGCNNVVIAGDMNTDKKDRMAELADLSGFYLIMISNQHGMGLTLILHMNLKKKTSHTHRHWIISSGIRS